MRRYCAVLVILISLCIAKADVSKIASPIEGIPNLSNTRQPEYFPGRVIIAPVGDSRSVMGPQGKNICVSSDGNTIAVVYGPPSDPWDADQPFNGVWVAYSTDRGATWNLYGPHNIVSPLRRIYPCVDGGENFHGEAGTVFFSWQEGQVGYDPTNNFTMIDENIPSSPSFSSPVMLSGDIDGWWPCIGVAPDNMLDVMVTSYGYHAGDSYVIYAYVSDDGGYTWSDSIRMTPPTPPYNPGSGSGGHFRWGTGGYAYYAYHAEHNSAEWPHFVETTDGGYTWSSPEALPALSSTQFWWHEKECEVINDIPFSVHNDISEGGIFHVFYPDPDDPGSTGSWNWLAANVGSYFDGPHAYQDTTWTCTHIQYPSISYEPNLDVIVVSFKANYEIVPPPAGWTDGNYQGGILSIDGGRNWYPTRPLSGPLLQAVGGPSEAAHRLATVDDTTFIYTTWTDADDAVIGNQYFELGIVQTIDASIFGPGYDPGVVENDDVGTVSGVGLNIAPTIVKGTCQITFNIAKPSQVNLKVYDATGRLVNTPFNGYLNEGEHTVKMNTSQLANGVYIISLESPSGRDVGKFIINR